MNTQQELLQECKLQLHYLNEKFGATGTSNALIARIDLVLTESTEIRPVLITQLSLPDELKFVDEDIRKEFQGKTYIIGTATQVQLNRDLKLIIKYLNIGK